MIETHFETQSKAWVKAREYACQFPVLCFRYRSLRDQYRGR